MILTVFEWDRRALGTEKVVGLVWSVGYVSYPMFTEHKITRVSLGFIYWFIYLFIKQAFLSATHTMTSGQRNIVLKCSVKNKNKNSLPNTKKISRIKQKRF